jgi:hypothetical protein
MITTLVRFAIAAVILGLVYAGLAAISQLPQPILDAVALVANYARAFDRIMPVHEALFVMGWQTTITLLVMPIILYLKLWKRFAPNA